ncbi:MAG: glycogen/starch synthase [Patescibacteria group bacterium]|nr:glycogen/starch synthase [Patescibacteria group bacterium]MDD5164127.1 glycogen/starch synthase [Patescibacteria group bacterium]MDD5534215.1 glycogen/starch synthase [Patescibacteria group bacterium]
MKKNLKIVHISAEVSPYSKTGGLGEVIRYLPRSLYRLGYKVIVITPYYGIIKKNNWPIENLPYKISIKLAGRNYQVGFKKIISPDKYPVFFVCQEKLFGSRYKEKIYDYPDNGLRFYLFNLAAIELVKILKFDPQIFHVHDWHTGLVPYLLKTKYKKDPDLKNVGTLLTIHNLNWQSPTDWWKIPKEQRDNGKNPLPNTVEELQNINFMKRGIIYADVINTVSERYAQEILTPQFGCELDFFLKQRLKDIYGIINGIDYTVFNPRFDPALYVNYRANSLEKKVENKIILQKKFGLKIDPRIPLIGLANRLSEQKGFELIIQILDFLLKLNLQIAIVGSGDENYTEFFRKKAKKHPKKLLFFYPFKEDMERKIYAASDFYLMPSRFEPCGISQLISLRYGSIPIVHEVGGLSDTIVDYNPQTLRGNGFVLSTYHPQDLLFTIARALENYKRKNIWQKIVRQAMRESYSWKLPAKKYVILYRKIVKKLRK